MANDVSKLDTTAANTAAITGMQMVMNAVQSPMYSVDDNFNVVSVNNALAMEIGKTPGECVGQKCSALFKSHHQCAGADCAVKKAMLLQDFQSQETHAQFNGKMMPVVFDATPIVNSRGEVSGAVNMIKSRSDDQSIAAEIAQLKTAALEGKLSARANPALFKGESRQIVEEINEMLDAYIGPLNVTAEYVERISKGDIPQKITEKYYGDFNEFKNNLNQLIDVVNMRNQDIGLLINSAIEGKLDVRADITKYSGTNGKMVAGINNLLDAVVGPLNVTAEYVDRISKGDIPQKISENYRGDFNEIKNNVNHLIDVVNMRNQDISLLINSAVEGKLDVRADITKYSGTNGKMVAGINTLLDSVIGPLNVTAEYVDRISKGDIPQKISENYRGDFNEIKNNVNHLIDVVNMRNQDINLLINSAVEGKLDVRADIAKYSGTNGKMVEGINTMLDSVIGPLNVTAEYVDRISKGDLPPRITEKYNGDFNEIKNNLNQLIDVVHMRNDDIGLLIKAAAEGQLGTRADVGKYQGANGKMVAGINNMLDVMVSPINEAMRVSHEYANCNFRARLSEELPLKGDFLKFRNALNDIGESVSTTIDVVQKQANEYANCNFTARIDNSADIQGDFVAIKDSMNNVGTSVSKALNVVNQQVVELAANAQQASASANEVSSGSAHVAKNVTLMSQNAEKGSEGIKQILKAMEDMSANIEEVASTTDSVSRLSRDANELSKLGAARAQKADQGMASITKSSAEVDVIIEDIKAEMEKIGKIVGLITNLANQTNLLALNAAIEAARAGDAGRGFAVVASEVKSLAQESRASAENISEMISKLQKKSEQAAVAMAGANKEVKDGSAALTETLEMFNKIVLSVDQISKDMDEVAKASEAQAAAVEQLTATVHEVSDHVQSTSKESMDAAAASEEASASVDQIARVIGNVNGIVEKVSAETAKFQV